jgi:hypothetical protein
VRKPYRLNPPRPARPVGAFIGPGGYLPSAAARKALYWALKGAVAMERLTAGLYLLAKHYGIIK